MNQPSDPQRKLRLLFWESTIRCNLSCAHCRRIESDEAVESDLTTEQAIRLIEQLAQVGYRQDFMPILVFSGGEPLCRKDIFELIHEAGVKGVKCALATNGTLIDQDVAAKIKAAGVERVSVSLDGATAEIHNKLRKLEGSFEDAVRGVGHLRKCGVPFQINMTVTRYNAHQLDDIFVFAEELGAVAVHLFMLVPVGCGEEFAEEDMLSADEYEQLLKRIARKEQAGGLEIKVTCGPHYERVIREEKMAAAGGQTTPSNPDRSPCPGRPDGPQHGPMSKGCLAGLGVLFVGHSGDVFPCGYLPVHCGNILQMPLEQIWKNSPDLAMMRDTQRLKGKCGVCGYRAVCGGCRARAFAATGDYMEAEPMCTYHPPGRKNDSNPEKGQA
jgi:radical SAM protein with 4Fe4S-binding SPASM domain